MSHTTTLKTVPIKSVTALREAVNRLRSHRNINCSLEENAKPRMYYRQQEVKCDFVLKLHDGQYDVGFQKQEDGSYAPIFDEFANYVSDELAVKACPMPNTPEGRAQRAIGAFSQEYSRALSVEAMTSAGYYLESETIDETGAYQFEFAEA